MFCILALGSGPSLYAQVTSDDSAASTLPGFTRSNAGDFEFQPIRTDSPRETFATFLRLRDEFEHAVLSYRRDRTRRNMQRLATLVDQLTALLDFSSVPEGVREGIGLQTVGYLFDIFGRIDLPSLDDVPELEAMARASAPIAWRIPGTAIRIARIAEGPREGEFLFSGGTIRAAPRMYQAIKHLPLRSSLGIDWSVVHREWTGPMIPAGVSSAVPDILHGLWWGTPIWKALASVALFALSALAVGLIHHALNRRESRNRTGFLLRRAITPLVIIVAVPFIQNHIVDLQINVTGAFRVYADTATTVVAYAASVWLFWLIVMVLVERIIVLRKRPEGSFDEQLLRIVAGALGIAGGVVIVGAGAQKVGLPLYSVVAGLGIGGLAVALAVRPTLENLIGGVMLYLDRPVRVGDFCSFGDKMGTIESIGVRTTKIRGLDRTVISVPNASLADMQLVNWASCDQMIITNTIGLRFETTPDQMRFLLVKIREMLHAHPKIDSDTVRVRYGGPATASRELTMRIYALTRDWNEYHAIREDIFLRIDVLVEEAGTGYAFPSQTMYMARDEGVDTERGEAAMEEVRSWRREGRLPFPRLAAERMDELEGSLDYPPRGSVDAQAVEVCEPLSAELRVHADEPKR